MSVKRRDLIKYFEENGFYLLREGGNHSIYTNGEKTIPIKRHGSSVIVMQIIN
ncbi:MAG: type II toxin-antitoxin system HicA family toxin [Microcystis aeruginosa WS75]|nr:type II toxin-antitoxin system HicA family toxin [Microcystis aeruginosa WS75]